MLRTIKEMLDAFERNNISYCHWKSNEHLEDALNGDTDLDILFLPNQRSSIEHALSEAGLKRFRSTALMQYNAIEDYIGFDKDTAKIWHLHLHYRLTLGEKHLKGYTLPWAEKIISNRKFVKTNAGDIYCSDPADECCLLLIRMALKLRWRDFGKKIGADDIIELEWLKENTDILSVTKTAEEWLSDESAQEIKRLLSDRLTDKNQLIRLQKLLRKDFGVFTFYSKFSSWRKRTIREFFWLAGGVKRRLGCSSTEPNRRISPSGGTVVAILGCDGAGKSTTLSYIKKEFNKKIDVYSSYMGSGDGSSSLLRKPMKIIAKKVGGKGLGDTIEKEIASKKKRSLKARLYSIAKVIWAVTLAKEKKSKLNKITKARNNGMLVLIDRYPQTEVCGYSDGPLLSKYKNSCGLMRRIAEWEYRIYESAYANAPDLLVKLTLPTEAAIERKPEMSVEEIENKKAAVRMIHTDKKEIEIDTNCELIDSVGKVMDAIWNEI